MRGLPACAALGLCVLAAAQSAYAGLIHYADVGNVNTVGVLYSNITESNLDQNGNSDPDGLYGAPVLGADKGLLFQTLNAFAAISTDGHAAVKSAKLDFDVQFAVPVHPTDLFVSEDGTFSQINPTNPDLPGGFGNIFGSITIYDLLGSTQLAQAYLVVSAINPQQVGYAWIGTTDFANVLAEQTGFHVRYENDLLATSVAGGATNLEKKQVSFDLTGGVSAPPPSPEPATLGLLGVGALALLKRRSR